MTTEQMLPTSLTGRKAHRISNPFSSRFVFVALPVAEALTPRAIFIVIFLLLTPATRVSTASTPEPGTAMLRMQWSVAVADYPQSDPYANRMLRADGLEVRYEERAGELKSVQSQHEIVVNLLP
ncbi:hypothetical protein PHYSODRAFT_305348 [Phytophthora sojae]|uniref:Uncharacterized protein n=1 Tax=Phytophthora sojae (strain P6497) TaxID=1094619 RepID=G5A307_PHYSP|nr:hypothetical protein PHYSODRAFT_305348 [Phytophthora sojae]EGZ10047.1 hypothetical protein PHYSODRAFT_305348 [Phytophthora sojae]|eukprot:XP_009534908.1 hypothetical protein PHYSODRAFT_305348 [Phytophthora sojae]